MKSDFQVWGNTMNSESVTIYDIASEAGVSIATVSRVLRGEANVSEATRKKVQDVIDRRNYRPSSIARGLTSKTTHSLGIILPKLLNPHYAMIFTGAQEEARKLGYTMSLFPWSSLDTREYNPAAMLAERRLDGLIVCVEYLPPDHDVQVLSALRDSGNALTDPIGGWPILVADAPAVAPLLGEYLSHPVREKGTGLFALVLILLLVVERISCFV